MSLRDPYRRTTYRVTGVTPALDIRIGARQPQLDPLLEQHGTRAWAFITAWNPGSEKLPLEENQRRQAALESEVKQDGFVFYRGAGVPDEAGWVPEDSILIIGMTRDDAVQIGKKNGQAAIVAGTHGAPAELVLL